MTTELKDVSDKELAAELARRKEARKTARTNALKERADVITEHLDALLLLAPEHSRSSCSDKNLANIDRGCVRCVLLDANQRGYWDWVYELELSFSRVKLEGKLAV
jgi:hypothetical protein